MKIHTTNNEKLTEQILTSPRQFWSIDLKNNRILQEKGATTTRKDRDEDISVSTIIVPKLTVMPDDIVRTCKTIQPKEQSKINQIIDFLNLQSYLKRNNHHYRRLVHMGYKMITSVIDILCPCPS